MNGWSTVGVAAAAAWALSLAPSVTPPAPAAEDALARIAGLTRGEGVDERALDAAEELLGELEDPDAEAAGAFFVGRARVLARQYGRAEPLLRRAVAGGLDEPTAPLYLAAALWENGRPDEAEEVLRGELETGRASARHQLARLLIWRGRPEEAVELLDGLAAAFGSRLDIQLDRARALEGVALESGDWEPALAAYERCRRLAPEHYEIRYGLARVLQRLGRPEEARAELEEYRALLARDTARSRERGRERARVDLALSRWSAGDPERALEELRGLPVSVEALEAIARVEASLGREAAARAALQRAIGLAPERADLRLRLDELVAAAGESG